MQLVRIGYWRGQQASEWPDPNDLVDASWDNEERETVAAYLSSGTIFRASMGFSPCRICGKPNGALEFTDGFYVWPEGLAHYVEGHGVRLPQVIVAHVNQMLDRMESAVVDDDWWRSTTRKS